MTARGAAPPVVEEGVEPNPPPTWRPGDPSAPTAAPPAPPPPPPAAAAPSEPAAERPARERLAALSASGGERSPETMGAFLDRLVRGNQRSGRAAPPPAAASGADAEPADEPPAAAAPGGSPDDPSRPPPADTAWAPPASKEEEERRIQAEVDRRAFKAQRQVSEQGRRTRQQQLEGLEAEEQQLRRTDVYAAAQRRDEIDAMRAQDTFLTNMVQAYDRVSLDPLMLALPEAERAPILEAMPPGMDGRKYVTETALARIKALAAADAERKLRRSPAFKKQVLAELRGEAPEDDPLGDEPELGGDRRSAPLRPNRGKSQMDAFIRRGFGQAV